jgi:hypothetical protein
MVEVEVEEEEAVLDSCPRARVGGKKNTNLNKQINNK